MVVWTRLQRRPLPRVFLPGSVVLSSSGNGLLPRLNTALIARQKPRHFYDVVEANTEVISSVISTTPDAGRGGAGRLAE